MGTEASVPEFLNRRIRGQTPPSPFISLQIAIALDTIDPLGLQKGVVQSCTAHHWLTAPLQHHRHRRPGTPEFRGRFFLL